MRFQFRLDELMVGVGFAGVYAGLVAATWGGWFRAQGIAVGTLVVPPAYLVALLMLRTRRGRRKPRDRGTSGLRGRSDCDTAEDDPDGATRPAPSGRMGEE